MPMWIQLTSNKHISVNGATRRYQKGDWVEVGRQTAMEWVAAGEAIIPNTKRNGLLLAGSGIGLWGGATNPPNLPDMEITHLDTLSLPYHLTCLWQGGVKLRVERVTVGFGLLNTWQIAAPLWNYDQLAQDVGKPDAQGRTKAIIRELRVPLYDVRLIFVKRCPETEQLMDVWNKERETGDHDQLTFLRAVYQVKPLILALPMEWSQEGLYK